MKATIQAIVAVVALLAIAVVCFLAGIGTYFLTHRVLL